MTNWLNAVSAVAAGMMCLLMAKDAWTMYTRFGASLSKWRSRGVAVAFAIAGVGFLSAALVFLVSRTWGLQQWMFTLMDNQWVFWFSLAFAIGVGWLTNRQVVRESLRYSVARNEDAPCGCCGGSGESSQET